VPVRHHARRFGESKYGLSRIYKVLLDMLVIKTVTSFMTRPLRWFTLFALPAILVALAAFTHTVITAVARPGEVSLVIAGTGFLFAAAAAIAISSGMLAELVYKVGDVREHDFARLTETHQSRTPVTPRRAQRPATIEHAARP
jgi:hypothetical protein